jgi:cardiolipin synthase
MDPAQGARVRASLGAHCNTIFLPDTALVFALNVCALRGQKLDIILPEQNNLPFVQWAMRAHLWQVLEHGCRVWLNSGPLDHSKLLVIDGAWALLGSANCDARSLRLNFEFDVECSTPSWADNWKLL